MIHQNFQQQGFGHHGSPYGGTWSTYCGDIRTQSSNQYLTFPGCQANNPVDQAQSRMVPVGPPMPTSEVHSSSMLVPNQQLAAFPQIVPYEQPTQLTMSEVPLYLQQPFHQPPPQIYNTPYSQQKVIHYAVPTRNMESHKYGGESVGGYQLQAPFQQLPPINDEVLWQRPSYEAQQVLNSTHVAEGSGSPPKEQAKLNGEFPKVATHWHVMQVKEENCLHNKWGSQDDILFSSCESVSNPATMSKIGYGQEVPFENSSEILYAVESSFSTPTSDVRSVLTIDPAALVFTTDIECWTDSEEKKSPIGDDINCSQSSLPRSSFSWSSTSQNKPKDFVYNPVSQVSGSPSLDRLMQYREEDCLPGSTASDLMECFAESPVPDPYEFVYVPTDIVPNEFVGGLGELISPSVSKAASGEPVLVPSLKEST